MKSLKTTLALLLFYHIGFAQIVGNVLYRDKDYKKLNVIGYTLSDNSLTFNVSILLNKKADSYRITLGLNEEATTVKECNTKINKRIDGFTQKLSKLGIKENGFYVDFISQNKIYDFSITDNKANQFQKGFEIKKNIIISTNSLKNIDTIIELASEFEIYDIVKVDYLTENVTEIYNTLFAEALKIAAVKKDQYFSSFNKKSIGNPTSSGELTAYTPENQYQNYKAYESSEVETYYNNSNPNFKKVARKNNTFYYEGISQSGMDKTINVTTPEVGVQYVLSLNIVYKIDTSN